MFLFFQLFLFASVNFVLPAPAKEVIFETANTVPPEKVRLLAKYVTKPYKSETEAMEVANSLAENLMADKNILKSAPRGFIAVKTDQNDRPEVAQMFGKMIKCAGRALGNNNALQKKKSGKTMGLNLPFPFVSPKNRSRRRLRRDDDAAGKHYAMIMIKKTGELCQVTIHFFAVTMALIIGTVTGVALAFVCSLVGLVQSCAKLCCECPTKFTPNEGCLSGFITGFGTVGYAALWLFEVPFSFNNPISNHEDLREKLQSALVDVIDLK